MFSSLHIGERAAWRRIRESGGAWKAKGGGWVAYRGGSAGSKREAKKLLVSTKAMFQANGAVAGQKYWYRVAAFNAAGQGAWSTPAQRPVM